MFGKYNVITICGSMRFYNIMLKAAEELTTVQYIVLMPHVTKGVSNSTISEEELDRLHRAKIDMSDGILVVTGPDDYIGDSTSQEIAYAESTDKPIHYYQPE